MSEKVRSLNMTVNAGALPPSDEGKSLRRDSTENPQPVTSALDGERSKSSESWPNPGIWARCRSAVYRNVIEPLVISRNPPWFDARAVAVGLVIGFVIPVGGQLACLGLLRTVYRFNTIVAAVFTLVSNPVNMIPLYYGYYCLGSVVLCRPIAMNFEAFDKLIHPVMDKEWFWEALAAFLDLGKEFLVRWIVAAVLLAVVFGVLGYVVTFSIQKRRCRRAAEKMGLEYEGYLRQLEQRSSGESCQGKAP
jgi:uncharacterized protein